MYWKMFAEMLLGVFKLYANVYVARRRTFRTFSALAFLDLLICFFSLKAAFSNINCPLNNYSRGKNMSPCFMTTLQHIMYIILFFHVYLT